jgi:hypothetical protein
MKKISQAWSALLFLLICASLTYWGLFFMAPTSQKVSLLPENDINEVSLSEATSLFGGSSNNESRVPLILRGVILSGTPTDSVAILGIAGSAPRMIRRDAEFMPGLFLQEVHANSVMVLDHGWRREIPLSPFMSSSSIAIPNMTIVNDMNRAAVLGQQRDARVSPSQLEGSTNAMNPDALQNSESKKP